LNTQQKKSHKAHNKQIHMNLVDDEDLNVEDEASHHEHRKAHGYAWEEKYTIEFLESGADKDKLQKHKQKEEQRKIRKRISEHQIAQVIRRGIVRYAYLVIDLSKFVQKTVHQLTRESLISSCSTTSMTSLLKQHSTRHALILDTAIDFIKEYFDQNPLSQLGLIFTRNSTAEKIHELCAKPDRLIAKLEDEVVTKSFGLPSLQSSLNTALHSLTNIPSYGSREVIMIYGSLATCDHGDLFETTKELKQKNIKVSIVQFDAEMYICKYVATETQGSYHVPLDSEHSFRDSLMFLASPPPDIVTLAPETTTKPTAAAAAANTANKDSNSAKLSYAEMIQMGFPHKKADTILSMCVCHSKVTPGGYSCPRCASKYCSLPTDCQVCSLKLVSSAHLARSYHHLFPVKPYEELQQQATSDMASICFSCQRILEHDAALLVTCPNCKQLFCVDCDAFIHESLHNCPGCEQ